MPHKEYKLGTPFTIEPAGFKQITLGLFGPGDPPDFDLDYHYDTVPIEGALSVRKERIDVGKGHYLLVYMFQNFAQTDVEVMVVKAKRKKPSTDDEYNRLGLSL
jgi:hypothetical protein